MTVFHDVDQPAIYALLTDADADIAALTRAQKMQKSIGSSSESGSPASARPMPGLTLLANSDRTPAFSDRGTAPPAS